jgi:hypothetical protein
MKSYPQNLAKYVDNFSFARVAKRVIYSRVRSALQLNVEDCKDTLVEDLEDQIDFEFATVHLHTLCNQDLSPCDQLKNPPYTRVMPELGRSVMVCYIDTIFGGKIIHE